MAGTAMAQTNLGSTATSATHSDAGASANTGAITFEAAQPLKNSSVSTTPSLYTAPSMFGGSNNCGSSDTLGVSVTGFGIGGSKASESEACNNREDTAVAYKLGRKDVAEMRFFCFGSDKNRLAWESVGNTCPDSAGPSPVTPKAARNNQVASATQATYNGR